MTANVELKSVTNLVFLGLLLDLVSKLGLEEDQIKVSTLVLLELCSERVGYNYYLLTDETNHVGIPRDVYNSLFDFDVAQNSFYTDGTPLPKTTEYCGLTVYACRELRERNNPLATLLYKKYANMKVNHDDLVKRKNEKAAQKAISNK